MTSAANSRQHSASIKLQLYLIVAVLTVSAFAIFQFQYWDSRSRDKTRSHLVEYHLATHFNIDRIQSELFEIQSRLNSVGTGQDSAIDPHDIARMRNVVRSNFSDIVERQQRFAEPAFAATLYRAAASKNEILHRLDALGAPVAPNRRLIETEIRYFAETLDQLARLHLNAYQAQTEAEVARQQRARQILLLGMGLIAVMGGTVVLILLRKVRAGLDRQFETDQQLIALNASLEDKIEQRTAELRAAKDEADRANESKTRFLAAASHDLRQPVQAITILSYALQEKLDDEAVRPLLENLETNTDVMVDLLNVLLDISKLDAGAMEPNVQAVAMADMLRNAEQAFAVEAHDKGIDLRVVPSTAVVRSDPIFLGRILQNFISNAIRYTDEGKILVGCRRRGALLRLDVYDTGKGIRKSHLEKIFDEFYQVDNPARNRRLGMGLGLAIVERLTRSLGHTLDVSSVEGRGSRFSVTVPLDAAQPVLIRTEPQQIQTQMEEECLPY